MIIIVKKFDWMTEAQNQNFYWIYSANSINHVFLGTFL